MILIVTNRLDSHSDIVIEKLHARGIPFYRLNTEDFPQRINLSIQGNTCGDEILFDTDHGLIEFGSVTSIWYRRPEPNIVSPEIVNPQSRKLAQEESETTFVWMWDLLGNKLWMNHPRNNRLAMSKLDQSRFSKQNGVRIPKYLITNNPLNARIFYEQNEKIAVKQISRFVPIRDGNHGLIYTNLLLPEDEADLDTISYAPVFFQEYIEKSFELRITVVGDEVYACKIDSQNSRQTMIDWRHYDFDNVPHSSYSLPNEIEEFCRKLLRHFHLNYGAIDMIVTPEGEFVFLEINPNGQWGWIENLTNLPISDSIIKFLLNGA